MMLVSVSTICAEQELHIVPTDTSVQQCIASGVGLVMFSIAVSVILTFGIAPNLLRRGAVLKQLEDQEVCVVVWSFLPLVVCSCLPLVANLVTSTCPMHPLNTGTGRAGYRAGGGG